MNGCSYVSRKNRPGMADKRTKAGERKVLTVYQSEKTETVRSVSTENWGEVLFGKKLPGKTL